MRITLLTFLFALLTSNAAARIRNGYEAELANARISANALRVLLQEPSISARKQKALHHYLNQYARFFAAFEATEKVIAEFKRISPDIYAQADTLQDESGREVDVFIQCIRSYTKRSHCPGTTSIRYSNSDWPISVTIKVWILNDVFTILAHELGHAIYQVQNFSSYRPFYMDKYRSLDTETHVGHHPRDLSGKASYAIEDRFLKDYLRFKWAGGKRENIVGYYYRMYKGFRNDYDTLPLLPVNENPVIMVDE